MQDPEFQTVPAARVVLRRFVPADAFAFAAYRSDRAVARFQTWPTPYPLDEADRLIASMQDLAPGTPGTWFQFAVVLRATGELAGDCALRTSRSHARQAEIGFTLAATHQGLGLATEAVGALLGYAFGRLALHRLVALTDTQNLPAQRLLARVGFRREGTLRESSWIRDEWSDDHLYALLAPEFWPALS